VASKIVVKAPSSTANLGPGFDVFGLALDAYFDKVQLEKGSNGIKIQSSDLIPLVPEKNSAGLVIKEMAKKFKIKSGLVLKIKKGVPAGFGMGSSGASAAAAAVAFNALFDLNLDTKTLVEFAGIGEKASAGSVHYDNVAASILGGFVIVRTNPLDIIRIEPPKDLVLCVAIPKLVIPPKKTQVSRSILPKQVKLSDHIRNLSNAAVMTAGFMKQDTLMIGSSVRDIIVEPARQHLIPGFIQVKENALQAGALGFTISGAGPSVIAFASKTSNAKKICAAMEAGFKSVKIKCQTVICRPSKGAAIL
jgi:homoserine kinase